MYMTLFLIAFSVFCLIIILAGLFLKGRFDEKLRFLIDELRRVREVTDNQAVTLKSELNDRVSQLNSSVISILQKNSMDVSSRFEASNKVFSELKSSITRIDESNKRIMDLGSSIVELQNILKAPKPRGNLGEVLLEDILGQIFPVGSFQMQFYFKKTDRIVDAVIKLREGLIPVDAKFPLEYFNKMIASDDENVSGENRKLFIKMVKKHINDISEKYIVPSEGTFDFALMYIPAENIYYEAIIRDESFGEPNSILQYSVSRKVIPVSPNTFFAYIQTLLFGLKGLKVEDEAKTIMKNLAKVERDLSKFGVCFSQLGKNIDRVKSSFKTAENRWGFLNRRIEGAISGDYSPVDDRILQDNRPSDTAQ